MSRNKLGTVNYGFDSGEKIITPVPEFKCNECKQTFARKDRLPNHFKYHHNDINFGSTSSYIDRALPLLRCNFSECEFLAVYMSHVNDHYPWHASHPGEVYKYKGKLGANLPPRPEESHSPDPVPRSGEGPNRRGERSQSAASKSIHPGSSQTSSSLANQWDYMTKAEAAQSHNNRQGSGDYQAPRGREGPNRRGESSQSAASKSIHPGSSQTSSSLANQWDYMTKAEAAQSHNNRQDPRSGQSYSAGQGYQAYNQGQDPRSGQSYSAGQGYYEQASVSGQGGQGYSGNTGQAYQGYPPSSSGPASSRGQGGPAPTRGQGGPALIRGQGGPAPGGGQDSRSYGRRDQDLPSHSHSRKASSGVGDHSASTGYGQGHSVFRGYQFPPLYPPPGDEQNSQDDEDFLNVDRGKQGSSHGPASGNESGYRRR